MKKITALIVLLSAFYMLFSFSADKNLLQLMKDSKKMYKLISVPKDSADFFIVDSTNTYWMNLSFYKYYHIQSVKDDSLLFYAKENKDLAETAFTIEDYEQAIHFYQKALEYDPENSQIVTYIGQCLRRLGKPKEALKMYEKAIKMNYFDYQTHLFASGALIDLGKTKKARKELLTAHVLNKNNTTTQYNLQVFLKDNKQKFVDWSGYPQCDFSVDADTIVMRFTKDWMFYTMCKALWIHEPEYDKQQTDYQPDTFGYLLERENDSYLCELLGYLVQQDSIEARPEMDFLKKHFKDDDKVCFIVYEKILADDPSFAMNLKKEFIEELIAYVEKYKIEKIKK